MHTLSCSLGAWPTSGKPASHPDAGLPADRLRNRWLCHGVLRHLALRQAAFWLAALVLVGLLTRTAHAQADAASGPLQTVPSVDWVRYMGTWHEVAKYPNWFQRQCVADTSATYSLLPDGTVQVRNRCRRADGRMDEALGVARRVGGDTSPRAQVRFAPDWLAWLPVVWGTYWVVALEPDYQWVVVSEPGREYLWVLARTPTLAPAVMAQVETVLRQNGFDLARLERVAAPR